MQEKFKDKTYYKILRIVYRYIFKNSISFNNFAEDLGYSPDFMMEMIKGNVPISKKELDSICSYLEIEEMDLIEDDEFKKLKDPVSDALNLFIDSLEEYKK